MAGSNRNRSYARRAASSGHNTQTQCFKCHGYGHIARFCPVTVTADRRRTHQWHHPQAMPAAAPSHADRLGFQLENDGTRLWRRGDPPARSFDLPKDFNPFHTIGALAGARLHDIAEKTNTRLVAAVRSRAAARNVFQVDIWGAPPDVVEAEAALRAWLDEFRIASPAPVGKKLFARVNSARRHAEEEHEEIMERILDEERHQAYRRLPTGNQKFRYCMYIPWDHANHRSLSEMLGPEMQALDSVRTTYRSYIRFLESGFDNSASGFAVLGDDRELMLKAVDCIRNFEKSILARRLERNTYYLVKPCMPSNLSARIRLVPYLWRTATADDQTGVRERCPMTMQMTGERLDVEALDQSDELCSLNELEGPGRIFIGHPATNQTNALHCAIWLLPLMSNLRYYHGHLEMRVDIGFCLFTNFLVPDAGTYLLGDFKEMLEEKNEVDSPLESTFSAALNGQNLEMKLARIVGTFAFATSPAIYTAKFVFPSSTLDSNERHREYFRFDAEFAPGREQCGETYIVFSRWTRTYSAVGEAEKLIDINLLDLRQVGLSYNLSISKSSVIDADQVAKVIPGHIRYFVENISCRIREPTSLQDCGSCSLSYPTTGNGIPTVPVTQFEQGCRWRTTIGNAGYSLMISKTQKFEVFQSNGEIPASSNAKGKAKLATESRIIPYEPTWRASVTNSMWNVEFNKNRALLIGEAASWLSEEWFWFPLEGHGDSRRVRDRSFADGDGIKVLFRVLDELDALVLQ